VCSVAKKRELNEKRKKKDCLWEPPSLKNAWFIKETEDEEVAESWGERLVPEQPVATKGVTHIL